MNIVFKLLPKTMESSSPGSYFLLYQFPRKVFFFFERKGRTCQLGKPGMIRCKLSDYRPKKPQAKTTIDIYPHRKSPSYTWEENSATISWPWNKIYIQVKLHYYSRAKKKRKKEKIRTTQNIYTGKILSWISAYPYYTIQHPPPMSYFWF